METIIMVLAMLAIPAGFIYGRWKDIFWSAKAERNYLKRNIAILSLLTKDRKSAEYHKINLDSGAILHKGKIWFAENGEITRATINEEDSKVISLKKMQNVSIKDGDKIVIQQSRGFKGLKRIIPFSAMTFETERGLIVKDKNISFHEGVPLIFVDEEHLTPIPFKDVPDSIKPVDLFSNITTYNTLQREKDTLSQKKELDLIGLLTLFLVVGALILGYINYEGTNANAVAISNMGGKVCVGTYQTTGSSYNNVPLPEGGSIQGDKIVVN